jgi:lysozyme
MRLIEKMLRLHEGSRKYPYVDTVGKVTIGIGRNLTDKGISEYEEAYMLENDIAEAELECRKIGWFRQLDGVRQSAVIDMVFNMGLPRFQTFVKANAAMAKSDFDTAAREYLDSKWAGQVGQRAITITEMIRTGEVPKIFS